MNKRQRKKLIKRGAIIHRVPRMTKKGKSVMENRRVKR